VDRVQIVGDISNDRCHLAGPELVDDCSSWFELYLGSGIDDEVPPGSRQLRGKGMTEST
jgi:hypothetical protein